MSWGSRQPPRRSRNSRPPRAAWMSCQGRRVGAGILSAPRWLCRSPWLQGHQQSPFPSPQGQLAREGITDPAGIAAPGGGKDLPHPLLPPGMEWFFFLSGASWDLAEAPGPEKAPSLPSSAKGPCPPPQAPFNALTGVEKPKEHLGARAGGPWGPAPLPRADQSAGRFRSDGRDIPPAEGTAQSRELSPPQRPQRPQLAGKVGGEAGPESWL